MIGRSLSVLKLANPMQRIVTL